MRVSLGSRSGLAVVSGGVSRWSRGVPRGVAGASRGLAGCRRGPAGFSRSLAPVLRQSRGGFAGSSWGPCGALVGPSWALVGSRGGFAGVLAPEWGLGFRRSSDPWTSGRPRRVCDLLAHPQCAGPRRALRRHFPALQAPAPTGKPRGALASGERRPWWRARGARQRASCARSGRALAFGRLGAGGASSILRWCAGRASAGLR